MKKLILIVLILFGAVGATAEGSFELTASCPHDGENAYFSSAKVTPSGDTACKYEHTHYDTRTGRTLTHAFWIPCLDN